MIDDPRTESFIQDILTNYSTAYRTYKNTLMFLVSDQNEYNGFKENICRYLALKAINEDKEIQKTLTEVDKEKANQKLKEIDSALWFKTISVYRYLIKGSKDGIKKFDLGIPSTGEKLSFTARVKNYLKDQEELIDKLSPKVLIERTFSEKDERKNLVEIWEAFLKYYELPMLEGEYVLKDTIVKGVKDGVFGLLMNDKVWYQEIVSIPEISNEIFVLRKEVALKMKGEVKEVVSVEKALPTLPTETLAPKKVPEKALRRIVLKAKVPWDKLSDLMRGVFMPLNREGARISLEVKIEAHSEEGISKDTLDLKIKETLNQIGAKIIEEEAE
jgi:hypothetical protein